MNPQIFELAEQAGMNSFNRRSDGFYVVDEKVFQRFAELIVKECTNMLPPDSIRDKNGVHMFYVIRKHFGVSEIGR